MSSQSSYTSLEFSHVFLSYSVCITEFLLGKFKLLESTPSIIPSNTWIRVQGWFQMEQICPKLNAFLSYTLLWVVFCSWLVLLLLKINPHFDGFYLYNNCKSSLLFFFFKLIIFREPVFSIENFFWSSLSLSLSLSRQDYSVSILLKIILLLLLLDWQIWRNTRRRISLLLTQFLGTI